MTDEEINAWLANFAATSALKQSYQKSELKEIFDMYNLLTMENKPLTTCSSCVTSVISKLKAECRKRGIRV